MQLKRFLKMVNGWARVRAKVKTDSSPYRLLRPDYRPLQAPKTGERASGGMSKAWYKWGARAKNRSRSRPRQLRSPDANMVQSSRDTCFTGHVGRMLRWLHSFYIWLEVRSRSSKRVEILKLFFFTKHEHFYSFVLGFTNIICFLCTASKRQKGR